MTSPGPVALGRGIVVRRGAPVPAPWTETTAVDVDAATVGAPDAVARLVDRLHRSWVARRPLLIRWDLADDGLARREQTDQAPWELDPAFLFPLERLRFLCFSNNYDARSGELTWWWSVKAEAVGARPGGTGDVVLADGREVWIDGGPRHPLPRLDLPVVHGESIEAGLATTSPAPVEPVGSGLAPDQLEAVGHLAGPARIIAPAGSGKTRALVARIRHVVDEHGVEPRYLTAVAYNARAAAELRERAGVDRSMARTVHSLGWAVLNEARPGLELIGEPEARNLLNRIVSVPKRTNTDPLGPFLEALDQVRSGLEDPATVEAGRDDVPGFATAFDAYRSGLYDRGAVDHGEQVYGAIEALLRDAALRETWQRRCRHLLVDEFQDLTPAYLLLLRLMASPQLQVFGVGDDDQVIYGYAGADPGFLMDFDRYFPGGGAHALEVNYRCPPPIVAAADRLLQHNERRIDKTIRPAKGDDDADALTVELLPGRDLAAGGAGIVSGWIDAGIPPASIAILARVNAALIPVKAALGEAGVGTDDLLSEQSLNRTTVRALFAWLRLGLDPDRMRRGDVLEAIRRPGRGLNTIAREFLRRSAWSHNELVAVGRRLDGKQADRWLRFCDDLASLAAVARRDDTPAALTALIDQIGLGASARTLDAGRGNASRSGHLDDLVAIRRAATLHPGLADFEPWLRAAVGRPPETGGVTLSSVHRVKGMEWDNVIVFGADRGAMPHDLSVDLEEERRVFHVALTRAGERAVVVADAARPSRFIAEMEGRAPAEPEAPATPSEVPTPGTRVRLHTGYTGVIVDVAGGTATVRIETGAQLNVPLDAIDTDLGPLPSPDADLAEALREWRLETSRRLGVPAFVVMHDRTLDEIARRLPATEGDLLGISGIGARKLEDYGDDILAIVAARTE